MKTYDINNESDTESNETIWMAYLIGALVATFALSVLAMFSYV